MRRHVHRQHDGVGRRGASACRCPARRRRRPSTAGATTSPTSRGEAVVGLLEQGIRPRQILTKEAFENAIAVTMALGGSTNAVLHLLAIAARGPGRAGARRLQPGRRPGAAHRRHQAPRQVPHGRPRPHRRRAGRDASSCSTPACCTATASPSPARPWPRTSPAIDPPAPDGEVVHPLTDPIHAVGGIAVLTGSLAPKGAVVKVAGIDFDRFEGTGPRVRRRGRGHGGDPRRRDQAGRRAWSSATRGPRAARACGRCWPSPAP